MSPKKVQAMKGSDFKKMLEKYLEIEGHSVVSFAEELGVNRVSVHRWASGKRTIDRFTAEAIRNVFKKFKID
ncbi:MAG: hypothetical protein JNK93_10100 [Planctomycetia bacterium]|nr:hypothetical protein [Planctomycetia bacterium]